MAAALKVTWRYASPSGAAGRRTPDRRLDRAVYALWHEHLLPLSLLHARQGAAVLVSRHRDGEILARVLSAIGYYPLRGSSTRGGASGLREMIRAGEAGRPLAFTPDGPRGPARRAAPGVVRAAAATGLPIVPVGAAARRRWRLESWDRFMIPKPFTKVYVSHGDPLTVPADVDAEGTGTWARRVGAAIDREVARCEAAAAGTGA